MSRLTIFDILHRTVVVGLIGISGWSIYVGVAGHAARKATLMERAKANGRLGARRSGTSRASTSCARGSSFEKVFVTAGRIPFSRYCARAQPRYGLIQSALHAAAVTLSTATQQSIQSQVCPVAQATFPERHPHRSCCCFQYLDSLRTFLIRCCCGCCHLRYPIHHLP
ncbi:hypothetical protein C8R46DRAFT_32549 [Mycena filopes]|nr:hypothetical protein C8R46DRAFT_32549 [Mycena filopes]